MTASSTGGDSKSVFISYARSTNRDAALALASALEELGVSVFLDTEEIAVGDQFPLALVHALLNAQVVVVFADDMYFSRWYCLRELEIALAAFLTLAASHASDRERAEALSSVVIALGPGAPRLDALPPLLRTTNWPAGTETPGLVGRVLGRLQAKPPTVGQRLDVLGRLDAVRSTLLQSAAVPPPQSLAGCRTWSLAGELRASIDEAFVGRADELWQIHHHLWTLHGSTGGGGGTVALEGGGGFGKTRLAVEYLHRFGPRYYTGGIFLVNAALPGRLDEQLHGILSELLPATPPLAEFLAQGRDTSRELQRAIQSARADQRILYLVDNVPEPSSDGRLEPLSRWCPAIGLVALLVTSRARQSMVTGVTSVPVGILSDAAARRMLTADYEGSGRLTGDDWQNLCDWVGSLALALEVLNASLRLNAVEPERLLALARDGVDALGPVDEVAQALGPLVPEGALRGVSTAFTIPYESAPSGVQHAARLLAFLAPLPIPQSILEALPGELGGIGTRAALSARLFVTSAGPGGSVDFFGRMHPLMAAFLRARAPDGWSDLATLGNAFLALFPQDKLADRVSWPSLNASIPHGLSVHARLTKSNDLDAIRLGLELGARITRLWDQRGLLGLSLELEESDTELSEHCLGAGHLTTASLMGRWAATLHVAGRLDEALALEEKVFAIRERHLGLDDRVTAKSLARMASTVYVLGDHVLGRSLKLRALASLRGFARRGDPGSVQVSFDLGDLDADQDASDLEDPDILRILSDLADMDRREGNLVRARVRGEHVLAAQQRLLGADHRDTLRSKNNLAATLRGLGELDEAQRLGQHVVADLTRLLGEEHPDTLRSMANLAETLRAGGSLGGAQTLGEKVVDERIRRLGPGHPATLHALEQLAATRRAQGEEAEAILIEQMVASQPAASRVRLAELG